MRKKPGVSRASSFQNGRLLLLLIGFLVALLAAALILLRGGLVVALLRGLRGFIGAALVRIVHMGDLRVKRWKKISQGYVGQIGTISDITRAPLRFILPPIALDA